MTIAVVTPWHEHLELADDYFDALNRGPTPNEPIIIDNGSRPPLPFAAVCLSENTGFGHASNLGLNLATAEVVVFLNNDIAGGRYGWLRAFAAQVSPGVLIGDTLKFEAHGNVDNICLPYLDGWCIAGMREDLLRLGGFDETYDEPAYYTDNDLCFRARAAGMRLLESRTGLVHKRAQTAGEAHLPAVRQATRANYYRYASRVRALTTA